MTTLSLVIPAYNEEDGIANIVNRVLSVQTALEKIGVCLLELIVVDDGSRDKTVAITQQIAQQNNTLQVIQHPQNRGYGAALKTGFGQAQGELIGFLDADGTYPPEHFPQLCQAALNGSDLVIGSRMSGSDSQMPLTRKAGNFFFANLLSLLGRQRITDSASGMRIFKRSILEHIYPLPDGLNLTPVMSTRAVHEHIRMSEVPIPYSERMGRSKLSVVHDGSLFLRSMVWTAMLYNPVRILGIVGMAFMLTAVLVSLWLIGTRLGGRTVLTSVEVTILFGGAVAGMLGISIFTLGITFNYLVALLHKRPIRQGLFGKPLFKTSLDQHFWWLGLLILGAGILIGLVSAVLGINGWEITRLWFYQLGSAMFILVGVQLFISWIFIRALEELNQREAETLSAMKKND